MLWTWQELVDYLDHMNAYAEIDGDKMEARVFYKCDSFSWVIINLACQAFA